MVLDGRNPLPLAGSDNLHTGPEPGTNNSCSAPYVPPTYRITIPEPNGVSKKKILCGICSYNKMAYRIQSIRNVEVAVAVSV